LPTSLNENIRVLMMEIDGEDGVVILKKEREKN